MKAPQLKKQQEKQPGKTSGKQLKTRESKRPKNARAKDFPPAGGKSGVNMPEWNFANREEVGSVTLTLCRDGVRPRAEGFIFF